MKSELETFKDKLLTDLDTELDTCFALISNQDSAKLNTAYVLGALANMHSMKAWIKSKS